KCTYHPNVLTRLRCSRCEKPICPRCMVPTPIGYRCPDCARGPKPAIYQASPTGIATGAAMGVTIAALTGVFWGLFPAWEFYWTMLLGFGVSESIAWAARYKRGTELMVVAMSCVVFGIILARFVMAWDSPFLTVDMLLNQTTDPGVAEAFQLEFIPDFIFMAIPFVINYIRFR
ncbi:MAG: B-box zinc finger protein, partial [Vicinamibacterales bacterium]